MKILIVDDDEIALEMLNMTLSEDGHEVFCASNGAEAMDVLRNEACRVVITDWEMPEMNGLELCRTIRQQMPGRYTYIMMLTSHNQVDNTIEGLSAGADDFLAKPFNPAELQVRLRTAQRVLSLESRDVVLFSMAKLAESRDPETGKHLERVRNYCKTICNWLSANAEGEYAIDAWFSEMIYLTSPLHDIGKIGIPDTVLLKPGRLSDREFEIMKTHTLIGAKTISAAMDQYPDATFLKMASEIAESHHERFDGTGYPNGLEGREIPLAGRITAIADVYDALTSKRVYKDAFNHDVAASIITSEAGQHFDPVIIEAFSQCEEKFIAIRDQYAEQMQMV